MGKFVKVLNQITTTVGKHSPLLLTIGGVVGLGATAVFSYKAAKKVEVIVERVEEVRANDGEVQRVEVVKDIVGAVALPVVTGVASIAAITLSYHIQNNRIVNLAAALATANAEHAYYRAKYKKEHGEEAYDTFTTPYREEETTYTEEDGTEGKVITGIRDELPGLHGQWFDKSSEYARDDHHYNMTFIRSVDDSMTLKLFGSGWIRMNEVLDMLGFERTKSGELLGWTTSCGFHLDPTVTYCKNPETGELEPQIYVKWSTPQYVYDQADYNEGKWTV